MTQFPRRGIPVAGAIVLALAAAMPARAQSNIELGEYPGPTCVKPQMPVRPDAPVAHRIRGSDDPAYDPEEVNAYNAKIGQYNAATDGYNKAVAIYNACMKSYIDNGNADMQRIKDRLDRAVIDEQAR